jgi:predicted RNA binding protein YcfA (HicA-like mRNA interferase family)
MKIPRDISGEELCKILKKVNFEKTRQTGSHIRLTHQLSNHHITIPNHSPIKIGTLSSILNEVSKIMEISKEQLIKELFT